MNVYIAKSGDHCCPDGGTILGVFATFEGAEAAVYNVMAGDGPSDKDYEWIFEPDGPDNGRWSNDFEWTSVTEHPVTDHPVETPANAPAIAFASTPEAAESNAQSL